MGARERRASDHAQDALRIFGAAVEERLAIGFEHVERGAVMIVRHLGTQGSKPLVQGLELRRVDRRRDQGQPSARPLEQRYD